MLKKDKEEKKQCMVMHEPVTCTNKSIMHKNLIQTTAFTIYTQSHNPRMNEHVNKMLENVMHDHMIT